jgi:hypothetical protein
MCEKRVRAQNPFGSILNPSAPKGHGADPLGVGANTQKSKQALFKIDKAPWVKKRAPTKNPFGSILHPSTLKGPGADPFEGLCLCDRSRHSVCSREGMGDKEQENSVCLCVAQTAQCLSL